MEATPYSVAPHAPTRFPYITRADGSKVCDCIDVFSLRCLHCHRDIWPNSVMPCIAVGPPWFGLLHAECVALYTFPAEWPHAALMGTFYQSHGAAADVAASQLNLMSPRRPPGAPPH